MGPGVEHGRGDHGTDPADLEQLRAWAVTAAVRAVRFAARSLSRARMRRARRIASAWLTGFVLTDMADTWSGSIRREVGRSLLGRAAEPDEIARVLLFLVRDGGSFITGQTILAEGAWTMTEAERLSRARQIGPDLSGLARRPPLPPHPGRGPSRECRVAGTGPAPTPRPGSAAPLAQAVIGLRPRQRLSRAAAWRRSRLRRNCSTAVYESQVSRQDSY